MAKKAKSNKTAAKPQAPINPPTYNTFVHCIGDKVMGREELILHNDDRANEPTLEHSDDTVVVGFRDIKIFNVAKQAYIPLSHDPDKFVITVKGDFKTAWQEFWSRWATYCKTRFNYKLSIEATNDF